MDCFPASRQQPAIIRWIYKGAADSVARRPRIRLIPKLVTFHPITKMLDDGNDGISGEAFDINVIAVSSWIVFRIIRFPCGLVAGPRTAVNQQEHLKPRVSGIVHRGVIVAEHCRVPCGMSGDKSHLNTY